MEDEKYMREAIKEAEIAANEGEVPVGAVVVWKGEIVSRAHNIKEQTKDATNHAEMVALRRAVEKLGHWRYLQEATMYVTVEPCPMCAGAMIQTRLGRLVYGTVEPKSGAVVSTVKLLQDPRFNHRVEVVGGVLEEECRELMQQFFRRLRE